MAWTNRQRSPTPFSAAFSRATSTASASLSPPITGRCHSLAMAIAKMPLPQPTSTALAVSARSSVASSSRQPRVVACVPVPNAMPASILQRQQAGRHARGVVRGMDPEGADRERLERALVLGDPISVGQLLPVPAVAGRRRDHGLVAFTEDLYAPRPVARDLAAGDHEALLGEMLQRLFAGGAVGCGHFQPGRPDAHAASMKLSKTFLGPAFSNSMSSLLPSTATMRP